MFPKQAAGAYTSLSSIFNTGKSTTFCTPGKAEDTHQPAALQVDEQQEAGRLEGAQRPQSSAASEDSAGNKPSGTSQMLPANAGEPAVQAQHENDTVASTASLAEYRANYMELQVLNDDIDNILWAPSASNCP